MPAALTPALDQVLLHDPERGGWLHFERLLERICIYNLSEIPAALAEIEKQVEDRGRCAAGFLAYEAAPAFDRALQVKPAASAGFPLLWFGIYEPPVHLPARLGGAAVELPPAAWTADIREPDYHAAILKVKDYIAGGHTYQVNFTYRLKTPWSAPVYPVFAALAGAHAASYAAYLETERWALCSISPELFFTLNGDTLTSRPMKGTARRGLLQADDQEWAEWLYLSEKNRAENVMIVDMVRNDMGRIARAGSVQVPELFKVERYPTVWQMTSTVQSQTSAGYAEIFGALFPCASITGAPKVRTMQIITELEQSPRRIYTGAIGYFAPGRQAQFNVAIRTLLIDKSRKQAEYGVGGGIVWDSTPEEEWEETKTKARILVERPQPFELLETMRWSPGAGWFLLEQHLGRLQRSAEYFGFRLDLDALQRQLASLAGRFAETQRVRLRLSREGQLHLEHQPLAPLRQPYRLALAKTPVNSSERFLYHKTTRRELYERALREKPGFDDLLLWNERGELTESTIANLVVELDWQLYTPPLACGLLPGVYREHLLGRGEAQERILKVEELPRFSRLYLVNSVRGMWEVQLNEQAEADNLAG